MMKCKLDDFETDNSFVEVRHCSEHLINNIKCIHEIGCSPTHECEPCKLRLILMTMLDGSMVDTDTLEQVIKLINKKFNYNFESEWINTFDIIDEEIFT